MVSKIIFLSGSGLKFLLDSKGDLVDHTHPIGYMQASDEALAI